MNMNTLAVIIIITAKINIFKCIQPLHSDIA